MALTLLYRRTGVQMNMRFSVLSALLLVVTACGKSAEEKRLETLESQIKSDKAHEEAFNRVFKEALIADEKSEDNLTILGAWRHELIRRAEFLKKRSREIAREVYRGARKTEAAINNALQWTEAALKEVGRYTQLFNETTYLRNAGAFNSEFDSKLVEAEKLQAKLEASMKISEEQENGLLPLLGAYDLERTDTVLLQAKIEGLVEQLAKAANDPSFAVQALEMKKRLEEAKKQLDERFGPVPKPEVEPKK